MNNITRVIVERRTTCSTHFAGREVLKLEVNPAKYIKMLENSTNPKLIRVPLTEIKEPGPDAWTVTKDGTFILRENSAHWYYGNVIPDDGKLHYTGNVFVAVVNGKVKVMK